MLEARCRDLISQVKCRWPEFSPVIDAILAGGTECHYSTICDAKFDDLVKVIT